MGRSNNRWAGIDGGGSNLSTICRRFHSAAQPRSLLSRGEKERCEGGEVERCEAGKVGMPGNQVGR